MPLDPVLARIPGLAGYMAQDQYSRGMEQQEIQTMRSASALQDSVQKRRLDQEIRGAVSASGGDPARAAQALVQLGTPDSIALAAKLRGMLPNPDGRFSAAGDGILNTRTGAISANPYSRDPRPQNQSNVARLMSEMAALPEGDPRRATYQNAIRKETETARQISPTIVNNNPQPVTPVTIADPADPTGRNTIIIDGRTRQTLGKGPKMTQVGAIDAKTELTMQGLGSDLQKAEDLLTGVVRTSDGQVVKGNKPTGSGVGALYDSAAGFVGLTPSGAEEAEALKTVAARLTSRIPRFEGPQSDKDVAEYKKASGDAGNEKVPIPRRLAAIRKMRELYSGYETGQRGRLITSDRRDPGAPKPTVVDW